MSTSKTTRAFEISGPSKAQSLAEKFNNLPSVRTGSEKPAAEDKLLSRMNVEAHLEIADPETFIVDCQSNFVPIVMACVYYASVFYAQLPGESHAKSSPATFTAYLLTLVYGFYLATDVYVRSPSSLYANHFMQNKERRDYLEFLLRLPVPDFMTKFFANLQAVNDPRRTTVEYVATLAGFSHRFDFGKFFPVSIFLHAHDYAARVKQNEDPQLLLDALMATQVSSNPDTYIGQYFGALLNDGTDMLNYDSQLLQSVVSIFNPAISRSIARKVTYSRINQDVFDLESTIATATPASSTQHTYDPYLFLLNASSDMISEMMTVLESVSHSLERVCKFSGVLGAQFTNNGSLSLLRHGYTTVSLPTYHYGNTTLIQKKISKDVNATKWAAKVGFLTNTTFRDNGTNTDNQEPTPDAEALKWFKPKQYPIEKTPADKADFYPDPSSLTKFRARTDSAPSIRIFDPYETPVTTAYSVILTGMVIETREIDGFAVPQPLTTTVLTDENSYLLQSAMPLRKLYAGTSLGDPTRNPRVVEPQPRNSAAQPVSVSFYDMARNIFGYRMPNTTGASSTHPDAAVIHGPTIVHYVRSLAFAFSKVAFMTRDKDNKDENISEPNLPDEFTPAWSCYRYVAPSFPKKVSVSQDSLTIPNLEKHVYALLNMRTNYGTNVTLVETRHYLEAIPIN